MEKCGRVLGKQDQYIAAYGGLQFIQFNPDESVYVDPIICSPQTRKALDAGLLMLYTGMTRFGLSAFTAITVFGLVVAGVMWLIGRWHQRNCREHPEEVEHLLALARSDKH